MPHYTKSHGLGNDYIVIDPKHIPFALTPDAVRLICDRHGGVGSDGILLLSPGDGAEFGVRIFNPDGSEAEKSGNGIRIFAKFLRDHGYTTRDEFSIKTLGGVVPVTCRPDTADESWPKDRVDWVDADMGTIRFDPLTEIDVDGARLEVTSLSIGNPHCVVMVPDLGAVDVRAIGPRIERNPAFPQGTNVQFVHVSSRRHIEIEIWERGAGYTLASGTSSCAAAAACHRKGLLDRDVTVSMPGGALKIRVGENYAMRLGGPVEEICSGDLSPELLWHIENG